MRSRKPRLTEEKEINFNREAHAERPDLEQEVQGELIRNDTSPVITGISYPASPSRLIKLGERFPKPTQAQEGYAIGTQDYIRDLIYTAEQLFGGFDPKQIKREAANLRRTNISLDDIAGCLTYFWKPGTKPEGYEVVVDNSAKQIYFVQSDVLDYLAKHNDVDMQDPQYKQKVMVMLHNNPLIMADNPNVWFEEFFKGRVVVARLEKIFSGREADANTTHSDYRNSPESGVHFFEHAATRHES